MSETKVYNTKEFEDAFIKQTLEEVVEILKDRGYNPINQLVGYLMSGDPGYISNYKEARNRLIKIDRNKILEVLVKDYIGE